MAFFRRDKRDPPGPGSQGPSPNGAGAMTGGGGEPEVRELAEVVAESMGEVPIERDTLELLQVGLPYLIQRECSDEAVVAGQTAARLGYLSRAAEFAMFEGELAPDGELHAALGARLEEAQAEEQSGADAMADLAADIATGEALDPSPGADSPWQTLPGLGGQARSRLRDDLVGRLPCPPDIAAEDLQRTWMYGYFLCALDELCED